MTKARAYINEGTVQTGHITVGLDCEIEVYQDGKVFIGIDGYDGNEYVLTDIDSLLDALETLQRERLGRNASIEIDPQEMMANDPDTALSG